jgi:hypothetical protein
MNYASGKLDILEEVSRQGRQLQQIISIPQ